MTKSLQSREYRALRKYVVSMRHESGLTQRQMAKKMGVQPSWIAKVEIGERRLDMVEFVWICQALDLDPSESAADAIEEML